MDDVEKKIIISSLTLMIIVAGISLLLRRRDICVGFLAGSGISFMNLQVLKLHLKNLINAKSRFRYIIFFTGYLLRYAVMGLALWVAINKGFGYFWSLAAGLFVVRTAIFLTGIKTDARSR